MRRSLCVLLLLAVPAAGGPGGWLAEHQDADGRWDCDGFMKHDPPEDRCDGAGNPHHDVGVTGLALLAFLGAGYTDRGTEQDNKYAGNVRRGLRFLMASQDADGCFGTRAMQRFQYNHAIATLTLCEAYWMTKNPRYKRPAQKGLDFIARSRNPRLAWRYDPRGGENDTSVTAWMAMALKSGKYGGLEIDPSALGGTRRWLDSMTDPETGLVRYTDVIRIPAITEEVVDRFPDDFLAMTAAGILTRVLLGEDPRKSEVIRRGADLCTEHLPVWKEGSVDMYYWYFGTLAMFQVSSTHWNRWNEAMKEAIVKSRHPKGSGSRTGSWDPVGPWGREGGRVYATALMVMCLEVYYRR